VQSMKSDFSTISQSIDFPRVRLYCEEWHKPPTVSGNWVPKVIEIAGGTSLCPEGKVSYAVSVEEVQSFDPQAVVLSLCGFGDKAKPEIVSERKEWQRVRAVRENKVFVIDDSLLNRPGPRLVDGARWLQELFRKL